MKIADDIGKIGYDIIQEQLLKNLNMADIG